MPSDFQLLLFSVDPKLIPQAVAAGVKGVLVDWESIGKRERQASADTEINRATPEDLAKVRACTEALVICRLNRYDESRKEEIELALRRGADEILLPMVQTAEEVEKAIEQVNGRSRLGILVETVPALRHLKRLAELPLSRVYVGLNDLAIERKSPQLFAPLLDGILEEIRGAFYTPFGFGGLTLPHLGVPVPCRLLLGEMARLDCQFTFLRRSFYRDTRPERWPSQIPSILEAFEQARRRSADQIEQDRTELRQAIQSCLENPSPL
ncbi:MAG: aldolase/citrate lyase family protein [bacterium]